MACSEEPQKAGGAPRRNHSADRRRGMPQTATMAGRRRKRGCAAGLTGGWPRRAGRSGQSPHQRCASAGPPPCSQRSGAGARLSERGHCQEEPSTPLFGTSVVHWVEGQCPGHAGRQGRPSAPARTAPPPPRAPAAAQAAPRAYTPPPPHGSSTAGGAGQRKDACRAAPHGDPTAGREGGREGGRREGKHNKHPRGSRASFSGSAPAAPCPPASAPRQPHPPCACAAGGSSQSCNLVPVVQPCSSRHEPAAKSNLPAPRRLEASSAPDEPQVGAISCWAVCGQSVLAPGLPACSRAAG